MQMSDPGHGLLGQCGASESCCRNEGACALQPAERVLPERRMAVHPRKRQRVQRLQQDRPDTPEERRHRSVDGPDRVTRDEPPRCARGLTDPVDNVALAVVHPGQDLSYRRGDVAQRHASISGSLSSRVTSIHLAPSLDLHLALKLLVPVGDAPIGGRAARPNVPTPMQ